MKILQICHSFPPANFGGVEVYTYHLCRKLSERNQVYVFYRINDLRHKEYNIFHYYLNGLDTYAINNTFRRYDSFESTYRNKIIGDKFLEILNNINPDIVHIQHLLYLSFSIIEEVKNKNIPIIFTLHDYWPICPQGQFLRNNYMICQNNNYYECIECILHQLCISKNVFYYYYFLKNIMPDNLFRFIMKNYFNLVKNFLSDDKELLNKIKRRKEYIDKVLSMVDIFIAPSEFLKDRFINAGIPANKIILNKFGFDLEIFKNVQKVPSDKIRFGFIGSILPAKGIHILIDAFNHIEDKYVELKIYGNCSSYKGILYDYFKFIKKSVKNNNIRFMGGFDNCYIADVFKEIDILIVPSIWPENSPLVIQEAFASKTPVIASRIGGITELVQDNKNGLLFEVNNVDSLYEKIKLIINNPKVLDTLRKNIIPPKDIKENAEEIENIYKNLIYRNVF